MAQHSTKKAESKLAAYAEKRDFAMTPEPEGDGAAWKRSTKQSELSFVVQRHAARSLHYDLRLEWNGVLKSWAVPKGPSNDPGDKRLAVEVEDHPLSYRNFEGEIPAGQYGSGQVKIWDRGTWQPAGDVETGLKDGMLKFALHGKKLRGVWVLIRLEKRKVKKGQKHWLLKKERDGSVRNHASQKQHAGIRAKPTLPLRAAKESLPPFVKPQLATTSNISPEGDEWIHELKLDGYRIQARIETQPVTRVKLLTRSALDWTKRMPTIAKALEALPVQGALLDGEVVVLARNGTTSFAKLQDAFAKGNENGLTYLVFDLLHLDGRKVRTLPLMERKAMLANLLTTMPVDGIVRMSQHIRGNGEEIYERTCKLNAEGIVSKLANEPYIEGRSHAWMKRKCRLEQEFVIGGFTYPTNESHGVGALLLGYYENGQLRYAGKTGTGFTQVTHRRVRDLLEARRSNKIPFANKPIGAGRDVAWVKPELVAQIRFATWTADRLVRQAAFKGLREDKPATEVTREEKDGAMLTKENTAATRRKNAPVPEERGKTRNPRATPLSIRLTHADRVLDAESGLTKEGLARYYKAVAQAMWPHIAGRPLTLVRCQHGNARSCFFQRHFGGQLVHGLEGVEITERKTGKVEEYLTLSSADTLAELAQFSVLEIHAWGSQGKSPSRPDRITIDLDPGNGIAWDATATAAMEVRHRMEAAGLATFLKSTGGRGLHVVAPIAPEHDWDAVKEFAYELVRAMELENRDLYLTKMSKAARNGKIYLDYLRNDHGATAIAPYSPRARTGAPVAVPLGWDELKSAEQPVFAAVNFEEWQDRLKHDPWKRMAEKARSLSL